MNAASSCGWDTNRDVTRDNSVTDIVRDWHVYNIRHPRFLVASWLLPPIFLPASSSSSEPAVNPTSDEKRKIPNAP